jgi:hypothetical protein
MLTNGLRIPGRMSLRSDIAVLACCSAVAGGNRSYSTDLAQSHRAGLGEAEPGAGCAGRRRAALPS